MYEAIDLGPSAEGKPLQIAYYDNGIGTQSIKFLAVLAGIFGIGLKANVLRLYRFACRNGIDRKTGVARKFYCFGFSRGAFTIRIVAAMLAKYGVVQYASEEELRVRTLDTFRDFMRTNNPNMAARLGRFARALRDRTLAAKRFVLGPDLPPVRYLETGVEFIGVWDTVAAYGGPIAEITRGIDDFLWPLTMTDTALSPRVKRACHAVSIDDERDSFQPVLWDEVEWSEKAAAAHPGDEQAQAEFRERLKQVWFAGMHSDVGGGYPDESLSYVSLVWMMDEAEKAGLRLLGQHKQKVCELSNSFGPIHNSRGGMGAYYRPQPRKIAAFLHPRSGMDFEASTLSLRDPVLGELPKPPHGVLLGCRVHESAIARLIDGTEDYAPATLPPLISIEPYSRGAKVGVNQIVPKDLADRLSQRDDAWYDRQERIWDLVLWRRAAYFVAVISTFLLVILPLWVRIWPLPELQDRRWILQRLTSWSHYVPVDWLKPWIGAFETNAALFFGLLILAFSGSALGAWMQGKARDASYRLWQERIAGKSSAGSGSYSLPLPGLVTRLRTGTTYQRGLQILKWRLLPAGAAFVLFFGSLWVGLAVITQIFWSFDEAGMCKADAGGGRRSVQFMPVQQVAFDTAEICGKDALWVQRGHRYQIEFEATSGWADGGPASPAGMLVGDQGWVHWLGMPFRRIVEGRYLQPIARLRPPDDIPDHVATTTTQLLRPRQVPGDPDRYFAIFDAEDTGRLRIYSNDAAFLRQRSLFYRNNRGTATVTVRDLDAGSH